MTPELTAAIERARHIKMTPRQKFEQRVSFVFSGASEGITKQRVRETLCDHGGYPAEWSVAP